MCVRWPPALWSCQKRITGEEKSWQHWQLSRGEKKRNCLWLAFRNLLWFDICAWQLITALQLTCCCCCCAYLFGNGRNQVLVPIANCKIHRKLHNFHSTRWGRTPTTMTTTATKTTSMNERETGPHGLTKEWGQRQRVRGHAVSYHQWMRGDRTRADRVAKWSCIWGISGLRTAIKPATRCYPDCRMKIGRNKWITDWPTAQAEVFLVCLAHFLFSPFFLPSYFQFLVFCFRQLKQ